jgi:integrase
MPESVSLDTRNKRAALAPQHEPYWHSVQRGIAIGYRKAGAGGVWYVRTKVRGAGYRKRVLGSADDDHPADGTTRLSWRDVLTIALDRPRAALEESASYRVADAFDDYWVHRQAAGRSDEALAFDKGKVKGFIEHFGTDRVAGLTTAELQRWRDGLVVSAGGDGTATESEVRETKRKAQATANRVWSVVRAGLNHAFRQGHVGSDIAWRRLRPFGDVDRPRTRFLSVAEAKRLIAHAPKDFAALAHAALLTGLRLGALTRLTAGSVQAGRLDVGEGKTGRGRVVPLTDEGKALFGKLAKSKDRTALLFLDSEGRLWNRPKISRRMADASAAAKLDVPATFHDLRRTYGSLLANAGARDAIIATALGHADTRMTRRHYAHLLETAVAKELQKRLPRFSAIGGGGGRSRKKSANARAKG